MASVKFIGKGTSNVMAASSIVGYSGVFAIQSLHVSSNLKVLI